MIIFNDKEIPKIQKKVITDIFYSFRDIYSFNSILQYIYNNNSHQITVNSSKNICDPNYLRYINEIALSKDQNIIVYGTIHENHHASNVLLDINYRPLFVKDRYIRIKIGSDPNYSHILVQPPTISNDTYLYYPPSDCYLQYAEFIRPYFEPHL
jgi:hypothetical protein